MKKFKIILCLFAALLSLAGCGNGQEEPAQQDGQENSTSAQEISEGDSAPDFTADTADGNTFILSEQNGKVVLLNFWATWCGPCVGEMPAFEKLQSEYGQDIAILAVDCMEDKDTVDQFISDNEYTFPIAYDPEGKISELYPSDGIPYTLIIGKDGTVRNIYMGAFDADKQYREYKSAIDSALAKDKETAKYTR